MRGIRAISCNVFSRSQVASRDPPLFRITERYLYSKSDMARFIAAVMINVHIEVLDYVDIVIKDGALFLKNKVSSTGEPYKETL